MKFPFITLIIILLFCCEVFALPQDSVLATVGPLKLTADEFTKRYELMPQVNRGIKDQTIEKYNMLYSLIAEKLWALEAENSNLDTADIMETTFKGIEKMYVRDALYKAEIESKVKITNDEIIDGAKKLYTQYNLKVLLENDSARIFEDYKSLQDSVSFDSLVSLGAREVPDIEVKYGEMNKSVEDSIFKLNVGEFSHPIKAASGWLIFKVADKVPLPNEEKNANERFSKVKKIIEERQKDEIYNKFYKKFFPGKKVEADGTLFWTISDKISSTLQKKKIANSLADSERVSLDSEDILKIERELGPDTLSMPFIKFEKNPLTVKEFLRYFILEGFYSDNVQPKIIAAKLNKRTKALIEQELLAREGFKRGLQNLPEVKSDIEMWKDNYLANIYKNNLVNSVNVSENEVHDYYLKKNKLEEENSTQVNILEILTDSLEVVEKVLNELNNGKDFRKLASIHTKRKWTKKNGGEFGFFPSTAYGDIGRIAAGLKIGEVYGPLKTPDGYSIFKLIDKKEDKDSLLDFDQAKGELKKQLLYKKREDLFINKTVQLAKKYGVKINDNFVRSLKVLDLNMYTFKYFGFGGRIVAVPFTTPFTEWAEKWKETSKEVP